MNLREFADQLPKGGITPLAAELGISPVYLSQLMARQNGREPSPELCVLIERKTIGLVMRWDLRPDDWCRIWPELIGLPGSPEAKQAA